MFYTVTRRLSSLVAMFCLKHCTFAISVQYFTLFFRRYNDFHSLQMQTSCSYPDLVNEELKKYDGEVCKYFQVDRRQSVVSKIGDPVETEDFNDVNKCRFTILVKCPTSFGFLLVNYKISRAFTSARKLIVAMLLTRL